MYLAQLNTKYKSPAELYNYRFQIYGKNSQIYAEYVKDDEDTKFGWFEELTNKEESDKIE